MAGESPWIIDAKAATFQQDVIDRSLEVPVVIDFWAPSCAPCRQLAPLLEKLANEFQGKFLLAKVNIDEEQELAAAFGVQSIPWVVAFQGGQPVDQFLGVLPEDGIRRWLEPLIPSPTDLLLQEAEQLEATDPKSAEAKYRQALELSSENDAIRIRLARVLMAQGRLDESRSIINQLEARGWLEPDAERIKSELDVRQAAAETGGVQQARSAVEANPEDLSLRLKLADALAASQQHEEALQICLELVQRDRAGIGEEAKDTMVKIFDMLGAGSELVSTYRRKLATALY